VLACVSGGLFGADGDADKRLRPTPCKEGSSSCSPGMELH
jgi:hypothetical protein